MLLANLKTRFCVAAAEMFVGGTLKFKIRRKTIYRLPGNDFNFAFSQDQKTTTWNSMNVKNLFLNNLDSFIHGNPQYKKVLSHINPNGINIKTKYYIKYLNPMTSKFIYFTIGPRQVGPLHLGSMAWAPPSFFVFAEFKQFWTEFKQFLTTSKNVWK